LLNDLAGRFERSIGLDVSRRRLDELAGGRTDGWEFREADLNEAFPLDREFADVIIANQVIEHILDPLQFAGEIHRVLRPGGRCVITTPNIRYLKNIAYVLLSGYGPRTSGGNTMDGTWDDGHVHYFTHRDLRELFSQVGFRSVNSSALIDLSGEESLRRMLDNLAKTWPVREFLAGCIMLWAEK
jgi:SAM-dependent methyltransferase